MGVVGPAQELLLDEVAQHHLGAAAQQAGDGKGGYRRNEYHGYPGQYPGKAQGQNDLPEYPGGPGTQILSSFQQAPVHFLNDGVNGQNHKGQVVVHHAQNHRSGGADHLKVVNRSVAEKLRDPVVQADEPDVPEELVQQTVVFQHGHPGVGSEQEVHPHGQHDEHHGDPLKPGPLPGNEVGRRIADEQADEGRQKRQPEGPGKHRGIGPHAGKVLQGDPAFSGGKSVNHHHDDGDHNKQGHPAHIGHSEEGALILHLRPPHPPQGGRRPPARRTPRSRTSSRRTCRNTRFYA